ncbi:MerR family transcriptional regulator [Arthrobacter sp. NEB 688]|uniref:MerR family transcriptional regulator n=1 Tax=Arthrobacter sp. NEB 688 TaxID=904039 RepID=UPI001564FFCB|nr:MerR family transcriptional regulator [Arthrobacter sp. NEB 688]QKE84209.1 MerR family transcriptional regulator [Arthrobacter sp. NEB 688]
MRISELAEATGVPVHTLKFYLREGVLQPGRATSRTSADYDDEHVERVRLVRALVEHGGVALSGVRDIVVALTSPPPSRHDLLGAAAAVIPTPAPREAVDPEVTALLEELGWCAWSGAPALGALSDAVAAARAAGVPLDAGTLRRYAEGMALVAEADVDLALAARGPAEAMRIVVVGTVLGDPVLVALRRLAQEAVSSRRQREATPEGP